MSSSNLRWSAVDPRGSGWRAARRRQLRTGLAGFSAVAVAISLVAASGGAIEPSSDLRLLEQQRNAEVAALHASHDADLHRLAGDEAAALAALDTTAAADLEGLGATATAAHGLVDGNAASAIAAVQPAAAASHADLDAALGRQRSDIDAFFQGVLASLGPEGQTPTRAALDAAKRSLEGRRSTDLAAFDGAGNTAEAALQAEVDERLSSLDAELRRVDVDRGATRQAIAAAETAQLAAIDASLAAARADIDRTIRDLEGRHVTERSALAAVHAAQDAEVRAAGANPKILDDDQESERRELEAIQRASLDAQDDARHAAEDAAAAAKREVSAAADADEAAARAAHDAAKSHLESLRQAAEGEGRTAVDALKRANDAAFASLKATFDAAVASVARGHSAIRSSWSQRLARFDEQAIKDHQAVNARFDVERRRITRSTAGDHEATDRRLQQDTRARQRRLELDRKATQREFDRREMAATRNFERRLRLIDSEYFSLRIRAVAFREQPSVFESVAAAYDPATDPGSLWNVARRIGADNLRVTGAGVDVAMIDTGVVDVPGLAQSNIEIGPDFSFEEIVPDLRGRDTNGHGTHLAGIINGRDAAWGSGDRQRRPDRFLGIAPDARLISIKAGAADGSVDVTQVIAAINWVIENRSTEGRNIRVLNLAFGTDSVQDYRSDPLSHAVERAWRAGIVVVVAAGNDGWDSPRLTNPAQNPFVLAVAASQAVDGHESMPAGWSNGSADERRPDLASPGRSIVSLRNPGSYSDELNEAGRSGQAYVRGSGTSQAAAVTSGAVALLLSARPELAPDQVKAALMRSADSPGEDSDLVGSGYLRVDHALGERADRAAQTWEPSSGGGSVEEARGSVHIAVDGVVLEGEVDIFGHTWSGSRWSEDAWSGSRWSGSRWSDAQWSGSRWSGSRWSADVWSGSRWSGSRWSAEFWSGSRWSGSRWSSEGWSGSRWSGSRWSAGGWFGVGWGDGPAEVPIVEGTAVPAG